MVASFSVSGQGADGQLWGSTFPVAQTQRTIAIHPGTRWVNVAHGEAVRFVIGATEFGWKFDGTSTRPVDLQRVAPAGLLTRPVWAYVTAVPQDGVPRDHL